MNTLAKKFLLTCILKPVVVCALPLLHDSDDSNSDIAQYHTFRECQFVQQF